MNLLTEIVDPSLATLWNSKNWSKNSEYRRGIPAKPKKCIGMKVVFTPTNRIANCLTLRILLMATPENRLNHIVKPIITAKTAPSLRTKWKCPTTK